MTGGWVIHGTIWHWQTNPDHQPGAWWQAFRWQLRQAGNAVTPRH